MFEYKFVRVVLKRGITFTFVESEHYQGIIHQHASEGWRLVQIFVPPTLGQGVAPYFEIIFERPTA